MRFPPLPFAILAGLATALLAEGAEFKVGETIVAVNQADITDPALGGQAIGETVAGRAYVVEKVSDGHVRISGGWVDKRDVIPADEKAIEMISGFIKNDPNHAEHYLHRAIVLNLLKKRDAAFDDLNEAVRLDSKHPLARAIAP